MLLITSTLVDARHTFTFVPFRLLVLKFIVVFFTLVFVILVVNETPVVPLLAFSLLKGAANTVTKAIYVQERECPKSYNSS